MYTGSEQNPIQILEQNQEIRRNQEKVQYQRNRQALYQAHMGSQFDVLVAVIKEGIKGSDEEKNRILKSRIIKFFNHGSKSINVETQNFRERRQADYSDPSTIPVPTQLILYGVDFLSAKQIKRKFTGLNTEVQWLDDSHCKVKFNSEQDAKKGLQMNLKSKKQGMVKLENQEIQVPKGWFQLLPYFYLTLQRRLFGRYAASSENEAEIKKSNDYYMYQQAKKKFEENIAKEVTQQKYFQVMKKYHLVGENKAREKINMYRRQRNNDNQYNNRDHDRNRERDRDGGRQSFRDRAANPNYRRGGYNQDNFNDYRNGSRDNRGNGRQFRREYNQNRYGNRNNDQDQKQMERSRQKNSQNRNLDNLSMISRPVSHIPSNQSQRQPRKRKFSISQCSNLPKQKQKQDDNLSFILNQSQINSQQVLVHFNNLSLLEQQINSPQQRGNQFKQQQQNNLSIISRGDSMSRKSARGRVAHQQAPNQINTSFNLNQSAIMTKKKNNGNTQVLLDQTVKPNNSKANCSIEQITIYD